MIACFVHAGEKDDMKEHEPTTRMNPKVPDGPAPLPPPMDGSDNVEHKPENDLRAEGEEDTLVPPLPKARVLDMSDEDEEPSASYSTSVEQVAHYDLEMIHEFEDWVVVDGE